jgi:hypothetical protein
MNAIMKFCPFEQIFNQILLIVGNLNGLSQEFVEHRRMKLRDARGGQMSKFALS